MGQPCSPFVLFLFFWSFQRANGKAPLTRSIETLARDYTREKGLPESVFTIYRSLYSYDRTELDARLLGA